MSEVACSPGSPASPARSPGPQGEAEHPSVTPQAPGPKHLAFLGVGWGGGEAGPAGRLVGAKSALDVGGAIAAGGPCGGGGGRLALLRGRETQRLRASPREPGSQRPRAPPGSLAPPGPLPGPRGPARRPLLGPRGPPAGRSPAPRSQAPKPRAPRPRLIPRLTSGSRRPLPSGLRALGTFARPQRPGHGRPGTGGAPQRSRRRREGGAGRACGGAAPGQGPFSPEPPLAQPGLSKLSCRRPGPRPPLRIPRAPPAERPRRGRPGTGEVRGKQGAEEVSSRSII